MSDIEITEETLIDELYDGDAGCSADYLAPYGFENDAEKLQSRMESAKEVDAPVFPLARGIYEFADSWYRVNLDAYTKNWGERPAGVCYDYFYTAGEAGVDCKHILHVKRLVANGYLPPRDVDDVEGWMEDRIDRFAARLREEIDQTISTLLKGELQDALDEIESERDYPRLTDLREVERIATDAIIE